MLRILTKPESFQVLLRRFAELRQYDVIDLCHGDERFPAIVASVDHVGRRFCAIKLGHDAVRALMYPRSNGFSIREWDVIEVPIPDESADTYPTWNQVGK